MGSRMGKHRQKKHYRRMVIAAVTIGAVGVPSVAMACGQWQDSGGQRSTGSERSSKDWRKDADRHHGRYHGRHHGRHHGWNDDEPGKPTAAPSKTPTPSAGTRKTTAPKPSATTPSSPPKTTAPKPKPKTTAPSSTPKPTATASGTVARIVELVNAQRAKAGCSRVTLDAPLAKAAQAHSQDMATHGNMSHTGSDGSSPGDRLTRAGYTWSTYGENVAYGYTTPEQVMAGWMASPGHKANILNCAFKEIGVGLASTYWTQDFATAR